jgi:hypothetical protein
MKFTFALCFIWREVERNCVVVVYHLATISGSSNNKTACRMSVSHKNNKYFVSRDCFLLGCDAVSLVRFVLPSREIDVISHNKTVTIVTGVLIPSVFSFTFSLCSYVFLMLSIFVRYLLY